MNKKRRNKLKQVLLELFIIVGFASVLAVYLAAAESVLVILLSETIASMFKSAKVMEFLPIFRTLLVPNFIVLHIEFARMFRGHDLKEKQNEEE